MVTQPRVATTNQIHVLNRIWETNNYESIGKSFMSKEYNARQRADRSGQRNRNWGSGSQRPSNKSNGEGSSRGYSDRQRRDSRDKDYRSGSGYRSNRPYGFKRGNKEFEDGRKSGDGRRSSYGKRTGRDERGRNDERDFKPRNYRKDDQDRRRRDDNARNWGDKKRNWRAGKRDYERDSRPENHRYDGKARSFGGRDNNYRSNYRDADTNRGSRSGAFRKDERNKYQDSEYRQRFYRSDDERESRYERNSGSQQRSTRPRMWDENAKSNRERNWKRPPRKLARDDRKVNPGLEKPADEPEPLTEFDERDIPFSVRVEVRGLPRDIANQIEGHFAAIAKLLEDDPSLALKHANAARRIASRLPVVREMAAEVAYQAGAFEAALSDYRAVLRMTGNKNYLPVIADCERAVGKPEAALRTLREIDPEELSVDQATEAVLVEAGARADMGNKDEAMRVLKNAIENQKGGNEERARLRYAYADFLESQGQTRQALEWFKSAAKYDDEEFLDIEERIAKLEGRTIEEPIPEEFEILDVVEEQIEEALDESENGESGYGSQETDAENDESQPGDDEIGSNESSAGEVENDSETSEREPELNNSSESKENIGNETAD